jgi:hypothetical protein
MTWRISCAVSDEASRQKHKSPILGRIGLLCFGVYLVHLVCLVYLVNKTD